MTLVLPEVRKQRTAECRRCGKTLHRTTLPKPQCHDCREEVRRLTSNPLTPPSESAAVDNRKRQKAAYLRAVFTVLRAATRRASRDLGRPLTRGEGRRVERRALARLRRAGVVTNSTDLPHPNSVAWAVMELVLRVFVAKATAKPARQPTEKANDGVPTGGLHRDRDHQTTPHARALPERRTAGTAAGNPTGRGR